MKNFTNNFKQFTSRLSARWLIMALMMLVGTSSAWAAISGGQVFYLTPGPWDTANAWYAMYLCNGTSSAQWVKLTKSGDYYTGTVPSGQSHRDVIFCRMNPSYNDLAWDGKDRVWNQTNDLTWSSGNCYTITGWGGGDGNWSTITVCEPATITWETISSSMKVEGTQTIATTLTSGAGSVTYTSSDENVITVNGSTLTAVGTGTATITATHSTVNSDYCEASSISQDITVTCDIVNTEEIQIQVECNSGAPNIYAWDTNNNKLAGEWAGTAMVLVEGSTNTYLWTYKPLTDKISVIFNKDGKQTGDITDLAIGLKHKFEYDGNTTATNKGFECLSPSCTPADVTIQDWNISTLCPGSSGTFTYTAAQGATVTWKMNQNNSDYTIVSDNGTVTITYNGTSTINSNKLLYTVSGDGFCPEEDVDSKKTISTAAKPSISASTSITQAICPDDKATLSVTSDQGTYSWGSTDGGETITSTSYSVQVGTAGTYTVTATNTNGCTSDPVSFSVTVNSRPEKPILVTNSTSRCQAEETVNLNTLAGVSGVNWYDSNSERVTGGNVSIITAGTYTFTAKAVNNEGCESAEASEPFTLTVKSLANASNYKLKDGKTSSDYTGSAITLLAEDITISNGAADVTRIYFKQSGSEVDAKEVGTYDVYIDTEEIDNICAGRDLNIGTFTISCQKPTSPEASSTQNVIKCGADYKQYGIITINPFNQNLTYKLNGETDITSATIENLTEGEYSITATRTCGSTPSTSDAIIVTITATDATPTITASAAVTQPNVALTLNSAAGDDTQWVVSTNPNEAGSITNSPGASVNFIATEIGEYVVTATNGDCSFNFTINVADAFYVYMRQPKKGENAYNNFYYPTENPTQGGDLFYKEYASIPPAEGYTDYNTGGVAHDIIFTDCDGYVWYGFKASDKLVDGTNYFTVHAPNEGGIGGYYTHTYLTKPDAMTSDIYYTMNENASGSPQGWYITKVSAPYPGPVVHTLGSTTLGTDEFAALYVTDCSGKEITGYQWYKDGQPYSSVCSYVGKKGEENSNAGQTNNIRPTVAGNYSCTVTYEGGTTATSAAVEISGTYSRSFTSNIPVLVVNTGGKGFPDCTGISGQTASLNASKFKAKRSVDVKIYDGETLVYDRKARMNYRGSSSLNFVKKSYAFCPGDANCEEKDGQADYVKTAKLNMLDVGEACDKDWVLYAAAADPSLMRNRLVFDSYKAMTGKWGVNSRYVELIVDGVYKGVYVFMDKITMNKSRVKVDEDKGFIVKFDKTDKEDRVGGYNGILGDEKTFKTSHTGKDDIDTYDTSIDQRFEIEYPEKDDYTTGWKARVDGIQGMFQAFEDALKQGDYATVQKYIDYTSWADWFIINEFTKNVDAYRASCIFVYTGEAGAKIEARPLWDQELSFNNTATTVGNGKGCSSTSGLLIQNAGVYSDGFPAPFWFTGGSSDITGGLLSDPCFVQVVKERWNMHQFGALSKKSLEDLVDEYEDDLAPEGTTDNAQTRETAFWNGKSRGTCDCSYDTSNATATGYQNKTFEESTGTITNWISDDVASDAKGRRAGLTTALNNLTGTSFSIQILPSEIETTPWEPVEIAVSVTPAGYDYKLEYTDNDLGSVANTIIEEEGDKITYRIPRPSAWGAGDAEEGERTDIEYGIKATLSVQDGTTVCGSQAAPSSTGKIILQDEDNENCE